MRSGLVSLALLLSCPALVAGQYYPPTPNYGRAPTNWKMGERISASGTIKGVGAGGLHVVSSAGDQWLVAIAPQAQIAVTGAATPSFLRSGMLVKFSGKFNRRGETVEPLTSVTVFTPREPPRQQRGREEIDPALSEIAKNLFKFEDPNKEPTAKGDEAVALSSGGAVASARGGKLSVRAPEGVLKIELSEDARVALDVNDLRLARPGDKVELEGWTVEGDVTKVVANRISVRLSETIGEKK
jgi:hypothetical protein